MPGKRKAEDSDSDSDSSSVSDSEEAEYETYIWGDVNISNPGNETRTDQVLDFPVHLPGFSDFKTTPKQIVSGHRHTLILGSNSKVYGWGCNAFGQLGVEPKKLEQSYEWIPIKALDKKRVVEIACGAHHCLARTDLGLVFSWGSNSKGQCGMALNRPLRIEPQPVKMSQATSITASGNTSYATDKEGDFYVWGYGGDGQCCAAPPPDGVIPKPTKIPTFETDLEVEVEEIAAGPQHVIVRSGKQIYTSGFGEYGRLGTGTIRTMQSPTEIKINEESEETNFRLGSGPEASFVISDIKGRSVLRGWGRVAASSTDTSLTPTDILVPVGKIKKVCGGKQFHSMLLEDGSVWNWGVKCKSLLGKDYDMRERRHIPQMVYCLEDKHIVSMTCSSTYEIVVVDQNKSDDKEYNITVPFFGRYNEMKDRLSKGTTISFETARKQFTHSYENNEMCDDCSEASVCIVYNRFPTLITFL